MTTELP